MRRRRSFIKLSGLTAFSLLAGGNLMANILRTNDYDLIGIALPSIHVRHGFFNVQDIHHNGIHIQRDIFNKNGLEGISKNRMASIKISDEIIETYGILDNTNFNSPSKRLSATQIKANKIQFLKLDSRCLIFAEFEDLIINGISVKKNQAIIQHSPTEIEIQSDSNQAVFIYKLI